MSSTNKTTNLELSQFIGSDSPKWLTDYNADMEKIDDSYQTVKAQADATDLIVGGHTTSITSIQTTVTEQGTAISGLRTSVNGNTGSINTINELLGNGTPTTTDKTIIGAINEIQSEVEDLLPSTEFETFTYSVAASDTTLNHALASAITALIASLGTKTIVVKNFYSSALNLHFSVINDTNTLTIASSNISALRFERVSIGTTSFALYSGQISDDVSAAVFREVSIAIADSAITFTDLGAATPSGSITFAYEVTY